MSLTKLKQIDPESAPTTYVITSNGPGTEPSWEANSNVSDHNDLNNIQGGIATERYHLTDSELTKLQNITANGAGDDWVSGLVISEASPSANGTVDYTSGTYLINGVLKTISSGGNYDLDALYLSSMTNGDKAYVSIHVDNDEVIESTIGLVVGSNSSVQYAPIPADSVCLAQILIHRQSDVIQDIKDNDIIDCRGHLVNDFDEMVKVSFDDTTEKYLEDTLSNNGNVTFTVENPGANETLKADAPVDSVAGKTGVVTLVEADITNLKNYVTVASVDTLSELNAVVTDATLIDTGDSRLSDSRTCDNTFDNAATSRSNLDVYSTSEVDGKVVGLYDHKGSYAADSNTPDLDVSPSGILKGDAYSVSVAGNFFTESVEVGDVLIADQDNPTLLTHWTRVNKNISFGTTAGTACEGDDSRLSDSRTPTAHTHPLGDLTQSGATNSQVPQWNGAAWVPATLSSGLQADNQQKDVTSDEVVSSSTGSSSFIIGGAMSLTTSNSTAMDYFIDFSATAGGAAGSNALTLELWVDGVKVTERTVNPKSRIECSIRWLATAVATGKVIEVKYATTGSMTIHRRTVIIRGLG